MIKIRNVYLRSEWMCPRIQLKILSQLDSVYEAFLEMRTVHPPCCVVFRKPRWIWEISKDFPVFSVVAWMKTAPKPRLWVIFQFTATRVAIAGYLAPFLNVNISTTKYTNILLIITFFSIWTLELFVGKQELKINF